MLRNIEAAEDAIGYQIIRLTLQAGASKTGEVILTFPSQTPGTRLKERDAWLRILKWMRVLEENASSSWHEKEIHTMIPEHEQISPLIEEMRPPIPRYIPVVIETTVKKEITWTPSKEWFNELSSTSPTRIITKVYDVSPSGSGTYNPSEKEFKNLIFGFIFLILIIICTMLMSLTSTLYAEDSLEGLNTSDLISSSAPLTVSPNPDPPDTGSMIIQIPTNVPLGNIAAELTDATLIVTDAGGSSVSEIISPYVTIEPKVFPEVEKHVFLQPSISQKYGKDYVIIYSLTNQNISQVLPIVSFTLENPPLVIDYNVTPLELVDLKHIEYKMGETNYAEDLEISRPYENAWFRIIVRNKDTGEVISEDGIGRTYSLQTPKQLVVRESGNYSFEFTGDYGILDLTMKVKQIGNFP
ncbi:MAG: hypothetical protein LUQ36_09105 [Methanoregula sp.]|nr:hypothetical protein [Methanoregula sp.]